MSAPKPTSAGDFSFGRAAARALGAAVLVLAIATPLIWWMTTTDRPMIALVIALAAIVGMIVAIAVVVRRELRDVQRAIDELKARQAG